jgi:hypothetical protein
MAMDKSNILAKNKSIGNVFRCPHGVITVNIHGVSLHLTEEAFLMFSQMIQEAHSRLMDESLKILTKDTE